MLPTVHQVSNIMQARRSLHKCPYMSEYSHKEHWYERHLLYVWMTKRHDLTENTNVTFPVCDKGYNTSPVFLSVGSLKGVEWFVVV